jgi:hypothetical protein
VVNKPKAIGTAAETAVVKWLKLNGYPEARRKVLAGSKDEGDIQVGPGVILEVKSSATNAAVGQPGTKQLSLWMDQLRAEAYHSDSDFGALVVRKKGTTNPGDWWAYCELRVIMTARQAGADIVVCLKLSDLMSFWLNHKIGVS